MILILVLYALCASTFTLSKSALTYSSPLFFIGVRMIAAGLMLGIYLVGKKYVARESFSFTLRDWPLFVRVVLFHIYITYVCDACALQQLSSIESSFIYNTSPFVSALFSYWWFDEKMTGKKWLGLSLGFVSLAPVLLAGSGGSLVAGSMRAKLVMLGAVVSSAYGWCIVRKLVKDKGYSTLFVNGLGMFVGGFIALGSSGLFESWQPVPVIQWWPFVKFTFLSIIAANILFYNLYGFLLTRYTATFLSFAGFLCPLWTVLFGWLFLGESIGISTVLSFSIVSVGLVLFYQEELRQGYVNLYSAK